VKEVPDVLVKIVQLGQMNAPGSNGKADWLVATAIVYVVAPGTDDQVKVGVADCPVLPSAGDVRDGNSPAAIPAG
jgi:hypothetical protein